MQRLCYTLGLKQGVEVSQQLESFVKKLYLIARCLCRLLSCKKIKLKNGVGQSSLPSPVPTKCWSIWNSVLLMFPGSLDLPGSLMSPWLIVKHLDYPACNTATNTWQMGLGLKKPITSCQTHLLSSGVEDGWREQKRHMALTLWRQMDQGLHYFDNVGRRTQYRIF